MDGVQFFAGNDAPKAVTTTMRTKLAVKAGNSRRMRGLVFRVFFTGTSSAAEKATVSICRGGTGGTPNGGNPTPAPVHGRDAATSSEATCRQDFSSDETGLVEIERGLVHPMGDRAFLVEEVESGDEVAVRVSSPASVNVQCTATWRE